jgi:predicted DNA-binding ribbon-helix-helix protein
VPVLGTPRRLLRPSTEMKSPAWGRGAILSGPQGLGGVALSRYVIISMGAPAAYYTLGCDELTSNAVARLANLPIVPLRGATLWGNHFMKGQEQLSLVTKRSIDIAGRKTSVSLEDLFWNALREIATAQGITTGKLVGSINAGRQHDNLSSAIRLFVLDHYRAQADARRSAEGT